MPFGIIPDLVFGFAGIPSASKAPSTKPCSRTCLRLGWEDINLTGDYVWRSRFVPAQGRFRPLRPVNLAA